MVSTVHKIQSKQLQPFIQYILYNKHDADTPHTVTSFPNTNICLGISKGNSLQEEDTAFVSKRSDDNTLFSYTTGLYTSPHEFTVSKNWDEICIDFHPCGYYHFFNLPSQPKIIDEGFTDSFFSQRDQLLLASVFEETNLHMRSQAIEKLLISKLKSFDKSNIQLAVDYIHLHRGIISVKEVLTYTQCSERKMYTLFKDHFGITPKWYIRIVKIRQALKLITYNPILSLTEITYRCGYTDQSHFIKEAKSMCSVLPKTLKSDLVSIDNEVIISQR